MSCLLYQKSARYLLASEQSSIMRNVSQWKTTSASSINTRSFMSLLDNHQLKFVTNVQITTCYQIRMTSLPQGTQVPVTHVRRSHPAKTFDGSHPLNVFAEQPILNIWKGSRCQRHCQISEKGSHGPLAKILSVKILYVRFLREIEILKKYFLHHCILK